MGQNVKFVENAMRLELGLDIRKSYVSEPMLKRFFPELFK